MSNYPKYQASFFLTKEDQLVVRTDSKKEFKEMLLYVKAIKKVKKVTTEEKVESKGESRVCPKCQSEMWDNRAKKKEGEYKSNAPDFTCKEKKCGFKIWPEKK